MNPIASFIFRAIKFSCSQSTKNHHALTHQTGRMNDNNQYISIIIINIFIQPYLSWFSVWVMESHSFASVWLLQMDLISSVHQLTSKMSSAKAPPPFLLSSSSSSGQPLFHGLSVHLCWCRLMQRCKVCKPLTATAPLVNMLPLWDHVAWKICSGVAENRHQWWLMPFSEYLFILKTSRLPLHPCTACLVEGGTPLMQL